MNEILKISTIFFSRCLATAHTLDTYLKTIFFRFYSMISLKMCRKWPSGRILPLVTSIISIFVFWEKNFCFDFLKTNNNFSGLYVANRTTWNMREFRGSAFVVPVRLTSKFLVCLNYNFLVLKCFFFRWFQNVTQKYHERHQLAGENRLRFYVMSDVQPTTAGNWGAAADPPGILKIWFFFFLNFRHSLY